MNGVYRVCSFFFFVLVFFLGGGVMGFIGFTALAGFLGVHGAHCWKTCFVSFFYRCSGYSHKMLCK